MSQTRTLEFASEDGLRVTVTVSSDDGSNLRLAAIRSAMVNHLYLYPIDPVSASPVQRPAGRAYLASALIGLAVTAAAFAMIAAMVWTGFLPPLDAQLRQFLYVSFPILAALVITLLVAFEWKARRFRAKSEEIRASYAARDASPVPSA